MSKIELSDVVGGYALSVINDNFDKIQEEFQDNVLYRNNPEGEPNQLENDLDINSFNLLNIGDIDVQSLTVQGQDLQSLVDDAEAARDAAEGFADDAEASSVSSAVSEAASDVSADRSEAAKDAAAGSYLDTVALIEDLSEGTVGLDGTFYNWGRIIDQVIPFTLDFGTIT